MAIGSKPGTAIILGITADIGRETASRFIRDRWTVVGLGRSQDRLHSISDQLGIQTICCDLLDASSIDRAVGKVKELAPGWNVFLSCVGTMEPIGPFFSSNFDDWQQSIVVNVCAQLRVLHGIWPCRREGAIADVILLAGGGTNGPFPNYSAYCISKIALIKACELISNEENTVNAVAIGPGFVRTRIHEETIRAGVAAGDNLDKTARFFQTPGTSFDDIYAHIRWCMEAGADVSGGRNFSTVHDPWREPSHVLKDRLRNDPHAFRLRRHQPGETS